MVTVGEYGLLGMVRGGRCVRLHETFCAGPEGCQQRLGWMDGWLVVLRISPQCSLSLVSPHDRRVFMPTRTDTASLGVDHCPAPTNTTRYHHLTTASS